MSTRTRDHSATSVPWAVAIMAVALLPAVFVPVPSLADFFYLPKVLLLLGLELSLLALLLLRRITQRGSLTPARNPLALPLYAYWAVLAASTFTSVNPGRSLLGSPLRWEGLIAFLLYGGLILLLPLASRQEPEPELSSAAGGMLRAGAEPMHTATPAAERVAARVDQLLRWGTGVMILIVTYGVVQRYGFDPAPHDALRTADWWRTAAFSTLGNSNFLGSFTAAYLLLTGTRYLSAPATEFGGIWLAGAGFAYYGLLTSISRGAWLAAAVAAVVSLVMVIVLRHPWQRRRLLLLVGVLVLLTVVWRTADPLAGRRVTEFVEDTAHQSGTVAQRLWMWRGTLRAVSARPVLGWGLESLATVFPAYEVPGRVDVGLGGWLIDRAHNDFLQVAVSSGLLGLAAYLWLLWRAARTGWRILRQAQATPLARSLTLALMAGGAAHLLALATNISTVSESPTFWGLLGLIAALAMSLEAA